MPQLKLIANKRLVIKCSTRSSSCNEWRRKKKIFESNVPYVHIAFIHIILRYLVWFKRFKLYYSRKKILRPVFFPFRSNGLLNSYSINTAMKRFKQIFWQFEIMILVPRNPTWKRVALNWIIIFIDFVLLLFPFTQFRTVIKYYITSQRRNFFFNCFIHSLTIATIPNTLHSKWQKKKWCQIKLSKNYNV